MRPVTVLLGLLVCISLGAHPPATSDAKPASSTEATVRIDGVGKAVLLRDERGNPRYELAGKDGTRRTFDAEGFAEFALRQTENRGWLYTLLNISGPWGVAWVALGLAGQVLFTGRMVVQWLVSERAHRSVVPPVFWWMSLVGATMLLVYFGWRRDIVGVLGQGAGWLIYGRNLLLIYRPGSTKASDSIPRSGT